MSTAATEKVRGRPRSTSREAIVDAALRVLERDGAAGLTMRAVAREAGVGLGTLYGHVENHEQLLGLVFHELEGTLSDETLAPADFATWQDGVLVWVLAVWDAARNRPGMLEFMLTESFVPRSGAAVELLDRVMELADAEHVGPERVVAAFNTGCTHALGMASMERLRGDRRVEPSPGSASVIDDLPPRVARLLRATASVPTTPEEQLTALVALACR